MKEREDAHKKEMEKARSEAAAKMKKIEDDWRAR